MAGEADELSEALSRQVTDEVEPEATEVEPTEVEPELPPLTDFGKRYLETLEDEQERQIVERHVRKWDEGYAKSKRQWDEFKTQYEQLGDVEELRVGKQLHHLLLTDPMRLAEYLHQKGIIYQPEPEEPAPDTNTDSQPVDPRIEKLSEAVTYLTQKTLAEEQAAQERAQLEAFNKELDEAKETYGDFDRDTVIKFIIAGAPSIEAAVKDYQSIVQNSVKQNARQQAPSLLGSSGAPPTQPQADVRTMKNQDVVKPLTALLTPKD